MLRSWDDLYWGVLIGVGMLALMILSKGLFRDRKPRERRWLPFLVAGICLAAGCAERPLRPPARHGEPAISTPHGTG